MISLANDLDLDPNENAGRTQITRGDRVTTPTKRLGEMGIFSGQKVLHHGAGKAQADTQYMLDQGAIEVVEYDPNHPEEHGRDASLLNDQYDVVVSNYVLNVLTTSVRRQVLKDLARVTGGDTYVSVRGVGDGAIRGEEYEDGVITSRGTFQIGFTKEYLVEHLEEWFDEVEVVHPSGRAKKPASITVRVSGPNPENAGIEIEASKLSADNMHATFATYLGTDVLRRFRSYIKEAYETGFDYTGFHRAASEFFQQASSNDDALSRLRALVEYEEYGEWDQWEASLELEGRGAESHPEHDDRAAMIWETYFG